MPSTLEFYAEQFKNYTEEELIAVTYQMSSDTPQHIVARQMLHTKEIARRIQLAKPHWTLTPTFWISLWILIVSAAIFVVAFLELKHH